MTPNTYRFEFNNSVPLEDAEMTLHLATYAIEGLYGEAHVRLEVSYRLDESRRVQQLEAAPGLAPTYRPDSLRPLSGTARKERLPGTLLEFPGPRHDIGAGSDSAEPH